MNHNWFRGSPQEIPQSTELSTRLLAQLGFGAHHQAATATRVVRVQHGWNGDGGKHQEGNKHQQNFLHGVISFSGELRRDNVLLEAV